MPQVIPIFYNNLDRRADRRAFMEAQFHALGLEATRHPALDARTVAEEELASVLDLGRLRLPMTPGSRCNAVSHHRMLHAFLTGDAPAALMMEDDARIAPAITAFLDDLDWLPSGIGLVQFEKSGDKPSRRLLGRSLGGSPGRAQVHRLHSRTAGSACYLVTRAAAKAIVDQAGHQRLPIDHLLFSPNASPLFDRLGVAMAVPALARQDVASFPSDIDRERRLRKRGIARRLARAWLEVNRLPRQVATMALGARMTSVAAEISTEA